jgi:uncharacterized protein (DUF4213/DUF364 family)
VTVENEPRAAGDALLRTWLSDLNQALAGAPMIVEDVRIGVFYTAAELDGGKVGVAFTPRDLGGEVCCPHSAAAGPNAGRLAGQSAWSLAAYALSPLPLRRALGVATLNALSALAFERHDPVGGTSLRGMDALEAAGVSPTDRVALVGSFVPFIRALRGRVASLTVIDRHRDALRGDEVELGAPPERAIEAISQASILILTGSALVEGGVDTLLDAALDARRVVIAGPTAPLWPPPFFARGVDVLAGIRVSDGPRMLQLVGEGGSGAFFSEAAEKICLVRGDTERSVGQSKTVAMEAR